MKEVFTIVLLVIGSLIGAGFASGQEIYSFFYKYGINGLIGLAITFLLIGLTIYKSLKIIYKNDVNNYMDFLGIFIRNKNIAKIINIILNILLLVTFYIMIAGFGAYFQQEIGINQIIGSSILSILCIIVFFCNVKGILKASELIVPLLIVFIIFIGGINLFYASYDVTIPVSESGWLLSSISYCSYNMILLIPALISVKKQIKREEHIKYIAILSGIFMMTISILLYMMLTKIDVDISVLDMPVVYVIRTYYIKFKLIYAFIILASIFTTAISIGIGLLQNICKNRKSYTQFVLFMCISSLLVCNFSFSKLVNYTYHFFGYIGIIQLFFIIKQKIIAK